MTKRAAISERGKPMEQMNIFDYIEKKPDASVVVQKAPEKPTRSDTI